MRQVREEATSAGDVNRGVPNGVEAAESTLSTSSPDASAALALGKQVACHVSFVSTRERARKGGTTPQERKVDTQAREPTLPSEPHHAQLNEAPPCRHLYLTWPTWAHDSCLAACIRALQNPLQQTSKI